MKQLTNAQRSAYFGNPQACPFCKSTRIQSEGTRSGADGSSLTQLIQCDDCDEVWVDIYRLSEVQLPAEPTDPNKDDDDSEFVRAFIRSSHAFYKESIVGPGEEVMIGLYHPTGRGGTKGEFAMRWEDLGGSRFVPQLQVFSDAWHLLPAQFQDLLVAMADPANVDIEEEQFCNLLLKLGMTDLTAYTQP